MKDKITEIVINTIKSLNEVWLYEQFENITEETAIFGGDDGLDSLTLVMLITQVESDINEHFSANVLLASEKAMSMHNSPYNTVGSLVEFTASELEGQV